MKHCTVCVQGQAAADAPRLVMAINKADLLPTEATQLRIQVRFLPLVCLTMESRTREICLIPSRTEDLLKMRAAAVAAFELPQDMDILRAGGGIAASAPEWLNQ